MRKLILAMLFIIMFGMALTALLFMGQQTKPKVTVEEFKILKWYESYYDRWRITVDLSLYSEKEYHDVRIALNQSYLPEISFYGNLEAKTTTWFSKDIDLRFSIYEEFNIKVINAIGDILLNTWMKPEVTIWNSSESG